MRKHISWARCLLNADARSSLGVKEMRGAHAIGTFLKYLDGGVSRSVLDAADFSPGDAGARGQFLLGEISGWAGSHQRSHDFHFRLEIGTGLGEFGILRAFLEEIARGSSGVLGVR